MIYSDLGFGWNEGKSRFDGMRRTHVQDDCSDWDSLESVVGDGGDCWSCAGDGRGRWGRMGRFQPLKDNFPDATIALSGLLSAMGEWYDDATELGGCFSKFAPSHDQVLSKTQTNSLLFQPTPRRIASTDRIGPSLPYSER